MKLVHSLIVAAVLAIPAASSFAQASAASNGPVTRAQVRAELVQLEQAGYRPGAGDHTSYPVQLQAAEARVAAENAGTSGVGGTPSGTSASGAPAAPSH